MEKVYFQKFGKYYHNTKRKNTARCFFIALKQGDGKNMEQEYNYCMIPLTTEPNQQMYVKIPIDNRNIPLLLTIRYNSIGQYWNMDVADDTGKMILSGVPLIASEPPAANVLEQYSYMDIGSAYVIKINESIKQENPDVTNMGTDFLLIWGDSVD